MADVTADLWGLRPAVWLVAAITAVSGVVVAVRMYETTRAGSRRGSEG